MRMTAQTRGDFVAWVGGMNISLKVRKVKRLRLLHHHGGFGGCGYLGLDILPDVTFVAATYVVCQPGEQNSVVSVRVKLNEIDATPVNRTGEG